MDKKMRSNAVLLWLILVSVLFWILPIFLPSEFLINVFSVVLFVLAMGVVSLYGPGVIRDFNKPITQLFMIRTGIVLAWLFSGIDRLLRMIFREFNYPAFLRTSSVIAFVAVLMIFAASLHILALDHDGNRRNTVRLTYFLLGGFGAGILISVVIILLGGV